ncbi:MAG TPA: hypothetical protein VEC16_00515 [Alphaproteobacteria bacterium]|nr:hypothetical protein [Alphaproteobacteria bacterium]
MSTLDDWVKILSEKKHIIVEPKQRELYILDSNHPRFDGRYNKTLDHGFLRVSLQEEYNVLVKGSEDKPIVIRPFNQKNKKDEWAIYMHQMSNSSKPLGEVVECVENDDYYIGKIIDKGDVNLASFYKHSLIFDQSLRNSDDK